MITQKIVFLLVFFIYILFIFYGTKNTIIFIINHVKHVYDIIFFLLWLNERIQINGKFSFFIFYILSISFIAIGNPICAAIPPKPPKPPLCLRLRLPEPT